MEEQLQQVFDEVDASSVPEVTTSQGLDCSSSAPEKAKATKKSKQKKSKRKAKAKLTEISPGLLDEVIQHVRDDQCLPEEVRSAFNCDADGKELLLKALAFLNGCLAPRTSFVNASAEKAWSHFHSACHHQLPTVSTALKLPPHVCFHICLKTFQKLVNINYYTTVTQPQIQATAECISARDKDVLHYIAGYIVRKLKDTACRRSCVNDARLEILEAMKAEKDDCKDDDAHSKDDNAPSLTAIHDRGGLTYVSTSVTTLLSQIEQEFRTFSCEQCTPGTFAKHCANNPAITSQFYEITYDCEVREEDKHAVLHEIFILFYKVRFHHLCRKIMDEHRLRKKISKKQKGLRKTLKMKEDDK